ncbi:hypothetical protein AC578_3668 [Pseudocercospora eumusae]|uniref:CmcJ-like methyltransferase n=1 Tax=Pseudocercospora eumusae TaxID=321146 RepID=A0A139GXA7_9PEZI|nr:hypothetical protein AC578_3668 [Pseudocercospora eumusae]
MTNTITSRINFLARDPIYEHEKPYNLKFDPPKGQPYTNIKADTRDTCIEDIRGREQNFRMETQGFAVLSLEDDGEEGTTMAYEDFDDRTKCQDVYCKQVAEGLKRMLGASRVQIFEYVVRKRHAQFPVATGEEYQFNQPTNTAHIDMTPAWAQETLHQMNPNEPLPSSRFQFVNVWKPLRGPVRDWPLALCDPSTLSSSDLCSSDIVFEEQMIENYLVHSNDTQRWYYLSDQEASEAWVFLQADSRRTGNGKSRGVPHCSFLHPRSLESKWPRESIEVRAAVFFRELEMGDHRSN